MLIKLLSNGLSGANVELRRSNNSFYIRKKANTSSQSRLLMRQAEIMQCWDSELISIPQIIQTGKDDCGNFFIDMYYIEGDSLPLYRTSKYFEFSVSMVISRNAVNSYAKKTNLPEWKR